MWPVLSASQPAHLSLLCREQRLPYAGIQQWIGLSVSRHSDVCRRDVVVAMGPYIQAPKRQLDLSHASHVLCSQGSLAEKARAGSGHQAIRERKGRDVLTSKQLWNGRASRREGDRRHGMYVQTERKTTRHRSPVEAEGQLHKWIRR